MWLEQDDVLSGTVDALVVPADLDFGTLQYNAQFLTDEELDRYINDPTIDIHVDIIITDDEVQWQLSSALLTITHDQISWSIVIAIRYIIYIIINYNLIDLT